MPGRSVTIADACAYAPILGTALSPCGRYAAVVVPRYEGRTGAKPPVMFVADLDGGLAWQAAGQPGDTFRGPVFSADGRLAAFRHHHDVADAVVFEPSEPAGEGVAIAHLPPGAMALKWWGTDPMPACIGLDGARHRRVWVWDAVDSKPRVVSPPKVRVGDFAFASRSDRLAFVHTPMRRVGDDEPDTVLYWTPTVRKQPRRVALPVPARGYLVWSPDGRWLAMLCRPADHRLEATTAWLFDADTGAVRPLAPMDGHITGLSWTSDGQAVVLSIERGVDGTMWRAGLDGSVTQMGPGGTYVNGAQFDRSRGRMLFLRQDGHTPQHVRLCEPDATSSRRITAFNERLREASLRPYETVTWQASDGTPIEGLLALPDVPNPPVVVWLHGGPAEHLQRTFSTYFQVMLSKGWAVFAPNYRGSTGRGDAFVQALVGRMGEVDVGDVVAGLRALEGRVDSQRVAMVGWSYGGTLAMHCAMAWPYCRAVVAGAPVVDWLSVFGAVSWPSLTRRFFAADPWVDPRALDEASVVRQIGQFNVPALFLHGELDDRVPVAQSRLAYRLLQARRVPTELRLFPNEGHVFSAPWAVREMLARTVAWLDVYLGDHDAPPAKPSR